MAKKIVDNSEKTPPALPETAQPKAKSGNGNGGKHGYVQEGPVRLTKMNASHLAEPADLSASAANEHLSHMMGDAPFCSGCGHVTVRSGSCYKCLNCGNSMG